MMKTIISAITAWAKSYFKQADWNEKDKTSTAYIKNKPVIPTKLSSFANDVGYVKPNDLEIKMDKTNPTGKGILSLNRKEDSMIGDYSSTIGFETIAIGLCEDASGQFNIEPSYNIFRANTVYRDGDIVLDEKDKKFYKYHYPYSGFGTSYSNTNMWLRDANYHFILLDNAPDGDYKIYEDGDIIYVKKDDVVFYNGDYYKFINNNTYSYQIGSNPTIYTQYWEEVSFKTYLQTVGNGESDDTRSNAYTLDWDGNAWFSGDVYTGSTSGVNKDDGSKKLATEEYVSTYVANNSGNDDSKMDKENPVGTGSFSLNRLNGDTIGSYSFAEGYNTSSIGNYSHTEGYYTKTGNKTRYGTTSNTTYGFASHAEGYGTVAKGRASHAEGNGTSANGNDSHAEGCNTSSGGSYSHAEGYSAVASGLRSHAEGFGTRSNGENSHAEGYETIAHGSTSHVEGNNTTSDGDFQHVQGKYNISDSTSAHIVGNGINSNSRSNAHTLDWYGNAWYAGDVYIGSTSGVNRDDGSKKLATEDYVKEYVREYPTIVRISYIEGENLVGNELKKRGYTSNMFSSSGGSAPYIIKDSEFRAMKNGTANIVFTPSNNYLFKCVYNIENKQIYNSTNKYEVPILISFVYNAGYVINSTQNVTSASVIKQMYESNDGSIGLQTDIDYLVNTLLPELGYYD